MQTESKPERVWSDIAESTPDVFQLPIVAPQGLDGVGHFNFYDRERMLSFQWDGHYGQHVTVSHGGYGEAVKWHFDYKEIWSEGVVVPWREPHTMLNAAQQFQRVCQKWIEIIEKGLI